MNDLQPLVGVAGAPVAAAIVQVLKPLVPDPRWWPLMAVAAGLAWNLAVAAASGQPVAPAALLGVLSGLAASGAYSAGKNLASRSE